ncbi:hypothetical protein L210DRAFT_58985 [Boletus edulis BED1]|uniref:Uncharacterized protein n=1 Tax=Boletus edulis BED1 TaxID=1328754 RepID=A0AAD4BST6_BOLED|nr:hypothetical protein L210DRAFT_58985 [Boletus edulis BED1]
MGIKLGLTKCQTRLHPFVDPGSESRTSRHVQENIVSGSLAEKRNIWATVLRSMRMHSTCAFRAFSSRDVLLVFWNISCSTTSFSCHWGRNMQSLTPALEIIEGGSLGGLIGFEKFTKKSQTNVEKNFCHYGVAFLHGFLRSYETYEGTI